MVCCAIIAIIFGALFSPLRRLVTVSGGRALAWRPSDEPAMSLANFSLAARVKSFGYAIAGLKFVIRHEHNARIHLFAALCIVLLGTALQVSAGDWMILILVIGAVWFAETINTAFEYVCDVVSPGHHASVKKAKDIAAGAVLITAAMAVLVGTLVFAPYIQALFGGELVTLPTAICRG